LSLSAYGKSETTPRRSQIVIRALGDQARRHVRFGGAHRYRLDIRPRRPRQRHQWHGLATVAIGLLGLTMPPAQAAALLIIPSLITNVWQFLAGPSRWRLIRRTWAIQVAICVATFASAGLIAGGESAHAVLALGLTLIIYAVASLAKIPLIVPNGPSRGFRR
jgi:hypothetical protein